MPNLILDLMVDRVDLVDEGANSQAFIKLYKRKETTGPMKIEEILQKMKPEHADAIRAEVAKAKAEVPEEVETELNKAKADLAKATEDLAKKDLESVETAKKKDEEPDFEEVLKSLDPSIQKYFNDLNAQKIAAEEVAKRAAEEKATNEAVSKAKELKSLPIEEDKLVEVLKSVSPEVHEVLKAANKAIEDNGLFDEIGKSKSKDGEDNAASDAWSKIEKKAEALAEEHKISKAKAITMAVQQNPELYKEYLEGGAN